MNQVFNQIQTIGVVPVIVIEDEKDAKPLAQALCKGGLPVAEVTFRTKAAKAAIREMAEACPQILVGAGTILTTEQADQAIEAGAKFIVSPGLNPEVVKHCIERQVPVVPGCATPGEIEQALSLGLEVVKFFPAEAAGGIKMIKAMSAPYSNVKFMPTGGVGLDNLTSYLSFPKVIACGGSFMATAGMIRNGEFDQIENLCRETVFAMFNFEVKHIGINCADEKEANQGADAFANLFGFEKKTGNSSIFSSSAIEFMKEPFRGKNGHIAVATESIERAKAYLEQLGVEFDEASEKYKDGKLMTVYMKQEMSGFAVHLLRK